MNCPYCDHELDERLVTVSGETVVEVLEIWLEEGHLATTRVTILCVESKGTAPPKEPTTEPRAEQPH